MWCEMLFLVSCRVVCCSALVCVANMAMLDSAAIVHPVHTVYVTPQVLFPIECVSVSMSQTSVSECHQSNIIAF